MSVNQDGTNKSGWEKTDGLASSQASTAATTDLMSLGELFGHTSSSFGGRDVPEMTEIVKMLKEVFESRKTGSVQSRRASIVPDVYPIDPSVSQVLPGIVLVMKRGSIFYLTPFLFYSRNIILEMDDLQGVTSTLYNGAIQAGGSMAAPRTPASYLNLPLSKALEALFLSEHPGSTVMTLAGNVINLELYEASTRSDGKLLAQTIVSRIDSEWENSVLVRINQDFGINRKPIPNPYSGTEPYGPGKAAVARITPVVSMRGMDGILLPSNMEVTTMTTNPQRNYNNNNTTAENSPKVLVTAYANVSLTPFTYAAYIETMRKSETQIPGHTNHGIIHGWAPFRPVIQLNEVRPGPQLNSNGGIPPFIFALFTMMCANNNWAFSDVLRRTKCGIRGNLAALEPRLHQVIAQANLGGARMSVVLDQKNILDPEIQRAWIQQHVMPHAIFTIPIFPTNYGSAVTRWLVALSDEATRGEAMAAFISAGDAVSKNKFSEILSTRDPNNQKLWNVNKPLFHTSSQIIVDGTATDPEGNLFHLSEIDEQSAFYLAGKDGGKYAEMLLQIMYRAQDQRDTDRVRELNIRALLTERFNLRDLNINSFGRIGIMDPGAMATIGQAMSTIGTLTTHMSSGNTFANNAAQFSTGTEYAVDYVAGVSAISQPQHYNIYSMTGM